MKNVSYIAIYSPNPKEINSNYIKRSLNYIPSDKTNLETLTFAFEQKLEAFKNKMRIQDYQSYFKYTETRFLRFNPNLNF